MHHLCLWQLPRSGWSFWALTWYLVMIYGWAFHDAFSVVTFGKDLLSDLTSVILLSGQPLKHRACFWYQAWTLTSFAYPPWLWHLWWPAALVRWPGKWNISLFLIITAGCQWIRDRKGKGHRICSLYIHVGPTRRPEMHKPLRAVRNLCFTHTYTGCLHIFAFKQFTVFHHTLGCCCLHQTLV